MPSGRQGDIPHGVTVLEGARQLGVEIETLCGGRQTCGKCLITLEEGTFSKHGITSAADHLTAPNDSELACAERYGLDLNQYRLACSAHIVGDVLITVPETSQARKQAIRKEAGELSIEVAPAVRLLYVEVPPATPGGRGDWERLQAALSEQWELHNLRVDPLLLRTLQSTLRQEQGRVTATLWQGCEIIRVEPGYIEGLYGLAVDVGSTTLAGHLCDLRTGEVLATETMMNPQVRYGEDLISRISYANTETQGLQRLNRAIIRALNTLNKNAAQSAGIAPIEITDMVLVGNTVMHHLLLGIHPVEIGRLPFALATDSALDLRAYDIGIKSAHPGAKVHLLPCIAGYVGADNVAVLLSEYHKLDEQITLIVDVGTNAEILLGNKDRILSASSPTGPAFEGAQITYGQRAANGAIERVRIDAHRVRYKVVGDERWSDELEEGESLLPTGICGSGIIEAIAELHTFGLIDDSGHFVPDAERLHTQARQSGSSTEFILATTTTGQEITVAQCDVRAIQLAKGALYSGVRLLMDYMGITQVERIRLAGAFGSYIDPRYAMQIGLIPRCDITQVKAIGNAAGDGALIALLNAEQRRAAQQLAREVEYVETAAVPNFQEYFVEALAFPDASEGLAKQRPSQ